MKVYICEDSHLERTRIEEAVRRVATRMEKSYIGEIRVFSNPMELLEQVEGEFNIYLLDIDYGLDTNGIDLGKQIRRIDRNAKIIFLTSHQELAVETLNANIEPFSFIYKGDIVDPEKLEQEIATMFLKIIDSYEQWEAEQSEEAVIRISDQKQVRVIPNSKFLYLENYSRERKVKVQLKDEAFFVNDYLGNLKKLFDFPSFYTEAQSLILNMANVEELNPQELYIRFTSGHLIFVTKSFMKRLKKKMADFSGGR